MSGSANRRILKEYADLQANPVENVKIDPVEGNMLHWIGFIDGPTQSAYKGGKFKIEATFPLEYPFKAPTVKFLTRLYHPNVTSDGSLCVGLLKADAWKPSTKLEHADDALVAEIAEQYVKDRKAFEKEAQVFVKKYAS